MRYYSIKITNEDGSIVRPTWAKDLNLPASYTSFVGSTVPGAGFTGQTLPGALRVEIDLNVYPFSVRRRGSFVRIHGVTIQEISQAFDLQGKNIEVSLGMAPGLPLAKPRTNFVALYGRIYQCFGNWQGTDMYLEIVIVPPSGTPQTKNQIEFHWPADTLLKDAITTSLNNAFGNDYQIEVHISDQLKQSSAQDTLPLDDLNAFAKLISDISMQSQFANSIMTMDGTPYAGVFITVRGKKIIVYDGTEPYSAATFSNPTQIAFDDLVGQPTWISKTTINFKCVMRADIQVGDYIKMPSALQMPYVISTQGSASPYPGSPSRDNLSFSGTWIVREVHYFGDSRSPSGDAWVTTYDAALAASPATAGGGGAAP